MPQSPAAAAANNFILLIAFVAMGFFASLLSRIILYTTRSKEWYTGGVIFGSLTCLIAVIFAFSVIVIVALSVGGIILGCFTDYFFSKKYADVADQDLPYFLRIIKKFIDKQNDNGGSGMFFFGGGGGGSSNDSGFSGFSGGSSGGGGSNGSW